jgi:cyclopropane fatty-acyl-phospholipid synthase-like methyltransferase
MSLIEKEIPIPPASFDTILDKGTLDAIYPPSINDLEPVLNFFNNMNAVLKPGGVYILISLLQDHIIEQVVKYFS